MNEPIHLGGALIDFPKRETRPCPSRALAVLMMEGEPAMVRCGLLEGHAGPHRIAMEWTSDAPASGSRHGSDG